ncbi:DUF6326 family protein [Arthrobacter sp. CG_A4]|uniref:DUF6326 family protein n=1 Tax=Arthrobacter sp. CG_A4 TaxID=3071706 RepID=UPI002E09ED8A|nr:hypothetical protein [Arthrobacter sp. CG_A4]
MSRTTTTAPDAAAASKAAGRLPRIDVRLRIAALWAATMLVFAYVDLFSLYRPDVRAGLEQGTIAVFDVGQLFLLLVTVYVAVPASMVYLSLVLPHRANRIVNIVLPALYGVTIIGAAIGEWGYYVFGSVIEVVLLALVVVHAAQWRRVPVAAR